MKEANATSIEYFRDFRRVADLLNGIIFHGKQVINEEKLQELNPVVHKIASKDEKIEAVENTLDLSVKVTIGKDEFLLILQSQTVIHYAMPVRILNERGTDYYNQWKKLQKIHKEASDLRNGKEYLSGMTKKDKFYPVLHIVIYFGKEQWTEPKKMDDLFPENGFPRELRKLFSEKEILIFDIRHFQNIEWFQTDLQQVCGFLQRTKEKEKLKTYINANEEIFSNLPEDTYNLLTVMAGSREMKQIKRNVQNTGGRIDMCKAIRDMINDGRMEGERNGFTKGRMEGNTEGEERMAQLYQKLILAGRNEELLQASTDKTYRNKLMLEFGIA